MSKETKAPANAPLPKVYTIGIAGFSGMFAWLFTHPYEMWKNTVMTAPKGTSQKECLVKVWERGPFRGLSTGILRQAVYAPARLGCYPIFRDAIMSLKGDADGMPTVAERALAGALAGVFSSILTSPVEVCLVLQMTGASKQSLTRAAITVYSTNGITGYWRGVSALASRAALVGVAQVAVHDQVLSALRRRNVSYSQLHGTQPYGDNIVVNAASILTALFYSVITMPVEFARVRMSADTTKAKYKSVTQTIGRVVREEGALAVYDSFAPYFFRCATHTVVCFFTIEYITRKVKGWRAAKLQAKQ
ncbi:mitochondrial carrier protein [Trypanosoma equiperdum]|uniref:Mitochondrial carrier protein, putative n=4 Tax=Trypanozoon TaxID=39700 RepID=Q388W2_TRYB2|nr:mitochondrial 2-oxoglutarate/malate carrier protein, putative [Trypanosoma brucei gambiense DAL972]XP_823486.1 mitochondrial carrier protein, putative [Trypanosoma brucei brucei TREU927]RHW68628.1 mitochondrial carrier protein [Trypanosoma brucei equiperdum]SCU64229.1 mitochondrial carrier protein [Trypanosoma equiperdum]EAN78658.1 mitochondrial carrier protein, putative [Trypanosoma brucei brucei TREU927]CBH16450.1 mitochondrial 2-oxoglutarate/malate carrier protein, putative [Trypanosoma |eukprot:XP_011778714.1 mitochondrial 2-oxoglutarate/malate carrier protein, putative [Trypanosoma brucei gambiense DAL972]